MVKELISIIIPTFNRAKLLPETLDSIRAQTYTNWECILVDDHSTDDTLNVITAYIQRDPRFKIFEREKHKLKGANSCRNLGLKKSIGEYIVFFDSDDLMTPNHLEVKYSYLIRTGCDFVVAKTIFFNSEQSLASYYKFDKFPITAYNYISQNINWLTYDIGLKSELAKSIQFNEKLQSGQEYNYFSKLVLKSTNAVAVDLVLTLRRSHTDSIRGKIKNNLNALRKGTFNATWYTYLDIRLIANKSICQHLIYRCATLIFENKGIYNVANPIFVKAVFREFGFKVLNYYLAILLSRSINKGYSLKNSLKKSLQDTLRNSNKFNSNQ